MSEASIHHGSVVVLIFLLVTSAGIDIQQHRIPNVLSLGGIILGVALQGWASGFSGVMAGIGGAAVGLGIFLPFYLAHGMGAGDVKLMGAAGAFLGPMNALLATGLSLAAGGAIAVIILLARGSLHTLLKRYWETLVCFIRTLRVEYIPPPAGDVAAMKFPYAAAILIGTVATLWWINELQDLTEFLLISS